MSTIDGNAMIGTLIFLFLVFRFGPVWSTNYTVGDSTGWSFNVEGWENGKNFKAGDTLVFKYVASAHNVVIVDKSGYESCSVPQKAKTYDSENDELRLRKGSNYFICGIAGHCDAGMKIAAHAS